MVFDVPDDALKMTVDFAFPSADDATLRTPARFLVTMSHTDFKQRESVLEREADPAAPERARQVCTLDLPPQAHRKIAMQFMMPLRAGDKILYGRVFEVRFE
jgi:hypothetical protein